MASAPARRLRQARELAGFPSASAFARHCGIKTVTYQHHENGLRDITAENAALYSRFLGLPAGTLLFGERLHSAPTVRIFGYIGHGGEIEPLKQSAPAQETVVPEVDGLMALVVSGNDIGEKYSNGDVLFYQQLRPGRYDLTDLDNIECVIKLDDGVVLVGQMITDRGGQTTVTSFNGRTIREALVFAASPVEFVRRHLPARITNH
jgi:hypothetical protein